MHACMHAGIVIVVIEPWRDLHTYHIVSGHNLAEDFATHFEAVCYTKLSGVDHC